MAKKKLVNDFQLDLFEEIGKEIELKQNLTESLQKDINNDLVIRNIMLNKSITYNMRD